MHGAAYCSVDTEDQGSPAEEVAAGEWSEVPQQRQEGWAGQTGSTAYQGDWESVWSDCLIS